MIPYTTCMRFNRALRRPQHVIVVDSDRSDGDRFHWTLVPHSPPTQEPTAITVHSQDDQTLCFSWILDTHQTTSEPSLESSTISPNNRHRIECSECYPKYRYICAIIVRNIVPELHSPKNGSEEEEEVIDGENRGYLLIRLRRRKSLQRSIHIDPIALLDQSYYAITNSYLKHASQWRFNTFTLDVLTGGHSLSSLLFHFFVEYNFINAFKLDVINVLRCFRLLEAGYHDTNPYHNSVHAADVTQAMHCFIQEDKIKEHLTPLEAMCALLAAVSHDLDHPGVNQHFLIATKSHLAALYKNFSVLESHHWRFAISCFHESQIFDHLSCDEWNQIESLLKSLILATDITRQNDYIAIFKKYLSHPQSFSMAIPEKRHFILQIALKCADLGNPCRPWHLSKRWSEQICNEFYRQGDYEKQLNIPVTTICDRHTTGIARIQTDFFKCIVTPLFELWDQFLCSPLSRQLINNLRFNDDQWNHSVAKPVIKRRHSFSDVFTAKSMDVSLKRSSSSSRMNDLKTEMSLSEWKRTYRPGPTKCINGCGTPPNADEPNYRYYNRSKVLWDLQMDEEEEEEGQHNQNITPNIKPYSVQMPTIAHHLSTAQSAHTLIYEKKHLIGRRGSAPGGIGVYTSCELAAAAALVFLHGAVTSQEQPRRSSFPADRIGAVGGRHSNNGHNGNTGAKLNRTTGANRGRSLEYLVSSLKRNKSFYHSSQGGGHHSKLLRRQACSLDSGADSPALHWFLNQKPRRGSVPQEILIESLSNYTT